MFTPGQWRVCAPSVESTRHVSRSPEPEVGLVGHCLYTLGEQALMKPLHERVAVILPEKANEEARCSCRSRCGVRVARQPGRTTCTW